MSHLISNSLTNLAYATSIAGAFTFASNTFIKTTQSFFSPKPKVQNTTQAMTESATTNHMEKNIVIHFFGTFEDITPRTLRSSQTIKNHLNNPLIKMIEITQQSALNALGTEKKPKTILGLSAQQYVEGGFEDIKIKLKLKELLGVQYLTKETLKNHHLIFTGFSQGGGVSVQVAKKLLQEFNLTDGNISVLSINGAVHGTILGSLFPAWISDLGAFFFFTCLKDFKKGSKFFEENEVAIAALKKANCSVNFIHNHLDIFLRPTDSGTTAFNISPLEGLVVIGSASLATYFSTMGVTSFPLHAASAILALALSNHMLSPMAPEVGTKLREIAKKSVI